MTCNKCEGEFKQDDMLPMPAPGDTTIYLCETCYDDGATGKMDMSKLNPKKEG